MERGRRWAAGGGQERTAGLVGVPDVHVEALALLADAVAPAGVVVVVHVDGVALVVPGVPPLDPRVLVRILIAVVPAVAVCRVGGLAVVRVLEREKCQVGPKYASWPMQYSYNTALQG